MNTQITVQKTITRKGIEKQKRRNCGVGMDLIKCVKKATV
jgi:hypothetical protein